MAARIELADCYVLIRVLENRPTVVVEVAVVWRGEDSDHGRKLFRRCFAVHLVSLNVCQALNNEAVTTSAMRTLGFVLHVHE